MTDLAAIAFNAEGFMTDPNGWTTELGEVLVKQESIEVLTSDHWKIIDFCRATGLASGKAPRCVRSPLELEFPPGTCSLCFLKALLKKSLKLPVSANPRIVSKNFRKLENH